MHHGLTDHVGSDLARVHGWASWGTRATSWDGGYGSVHAEEAVPVVDTSPAAATVGPGPVVESNGWMDDGGEPAGRT